MTWLTSSVIRCTGFSDFQQLKVTHVGFIGNYFILNGFVSFSISVYIGMYIIHGLCDLKFKTLNL